MIINTLQNLKQYQGVYRNLPEAVSYIETWDLQKLHEGKNEVSENVYIVKILGDKNPKFEGIIEVHRAWIDIHIALNTSDVIAFKEISHCANLHKEYDSENDYALYKETDTKQVDVPMNYFCIIDPTMAHMAMLGEGRIEKLVLKIKL
jgi:YhcH/YjgK/YiaL family protein